MLGRLESHEQDNYRHLSPSDIDLIGSISSKTSKTYVDTELGKKAESTTLSGHTGNMAIHVTGVDKALWNNNIPVFSQTQPTTGIWFKEVL